MSRAYCINLVFCQLLDKYLFAIYDVNTGCCDILDTTAGEVENSFHLSVFTFHVFNACCAGEFICSYAFEACNSEVLLNATGNLNLLLVVAWVVNKVQC